MAHLRPVATGAKKTRVLATDAHLHRHTPHLLGQETHRSPVELLAARLSSKDEKRHFDKGDG